MPQTLLRVKPAESDGRKSSSEVSDEKFLDNATATTTTTTPRSVIIVPRSKSQATCRRVTPAAIPDGGATAVEKRLPNGDLYIGTFSNNTPHGSGKYLWKDGCMYEGDWKKGKAERKGEILVTIEGNVRSNMYSSQVRCMEQTPSSMRRG